MRNGVCRFVGACLLAGGGVALGGELRLANGAVIPGELVRVSGSRLVWAAELVGEIRVDTKSVVSVSSSRAPALNLDGRVSRDCALAGDAQGARVSCPGRDELATDWRGLQAAEVVRDGKVVASLTRERGNSHTDEYELDARTSWSSGRHRQRLEADLEYEKSRDRTINDEADLEYQFDRLLRDGWYTYLRTEYARDRLEAVQESTAVGIGVGRTFRLAPDLDFLLQAGPALAHFDLQDSGRASEEGGSLQWRVAWKRPVWRFDTELFHEGDYRWLFVDADISRLVTRTGIEVPLFEGVVAELRLDYERVGLQLPGIDNTDIDWVLALGYTW